MKFFGRNYGTFSCPKYILVNHETMVYMPYNPGNYETLPLLHSCSHLLHFHAPNYTLAMCPCYTHVHSWYMYTSSISTRLMTQSSVTLLAIPSLPHITIASWKESIPPTSRQCSPIGIEFHHYHNPTPAMAKSILYTQKWLPQITSVRQNWSPQALGIMV